MNCSILFIVYRFLIWIISPYMLMPAIDAIYQAGELDQMTGSGE
jgi:hypothetical protein